MTLDQTSIRRPDWLPHDEYPFTILHHHLPSGTVAVVDEGEGPALVFVHAGMWSFVWRDVIVRLRDRFRCIAVDFPGYGLAPDPTRPLGLAELSRLVDELVDELRLDRLTLVLHDLGGPVGLGFAGRRPQSIAGLVLANTFAWRPDTAGLRTMLRVMSSRPLTAIGTASNLVPRLTATRFGVGRHLDPAGRRAFLGPFLDHAKRRRFHRLMRATLTEGAYLDRVAQGIHGSLAGTPALTVFGERNDPFGFQHRHAATFTDHEGLVIPGGNHFPMMDAPDVVAETIAGWHDRRVS
jgi:haloalkane dehalogenase